MRLEIMAWGAGTLLAALILLRQLTKSKGVISVQHIGIACRLVLAIGLVAGCVWASKFLSAYFGSNSYDHYALMNRITGHYGWVYWMSIICDVIVPQFFWFKKVCQNMAVVFILGLVIGLPIWFELLVRALVGK